VSISDKAESDALKSATKVAIDRYIDQLRGYTLPHGKPGHEMFETIVGLMERDVDLISGWIEEDIDPNKPVLRKIEETLGVELTDKQKNNISRVLLDSRISAIKKSKK
jgi:hypothetical protein